MCIRDRLCSGMSGTTGPQDANMPSISIVIGRNRFCGGRKRWCTAKKGLHRVTPWICSYMLWA
eukprot:2833462-Ditylum_brightwellii.AAC.1